MWVPRRGISSLEHRMILPSSEVCNCPCKSSQIDQREAYLYWGQDRLLGRNSNSNNNSSSSNNDTLSWCPIKKIHIHCHLLHLQLILTTSKPSSRHITPSLPMSFYHIVLPKVSYMLPGVFRFTMSLSETNEPVTNPGHVPRWPFAAPSAFVQAAHPGFVPRCCNDWWSVPPRPTNPQPGW